LSQGPKPLDKRMSAADVVAQLKDGVTIGIGGYTAFHTHHFVHAQNELVQGGAIAGLGAKAMAAANKKDAGETPVYKKEAGKG
jgi:hypothetical protein